MLYVGESLSLDFRPFWISKPPQPISLKGFQIRNGLNLDPSPN